MSEEEGKEREETTSTAMEGLPAVALLGLKLELADPAIGLADPGSIKRHRLAQVHFQPCRVGSPIASPASGRILVNRLGRTVLVDVFKDIGMWEVGFLMN